MKIEQIVRLMHNHAHELPLTKGRRAILALKREPPLEKLLKILHPFGVELVKTCDELEKGDCKSWAFQQVGLDKNYGGWLSRDYIVAGFYEELRAKVEPAEGYLAAYFMDETDLLHSHWGVCERNKDKIRVLSRWGEGGPLLRHPLEIIPPHYGNFVEFIEVPRRTKEGRYNK